MPIPRRLLAHDIEVRLPDGKGGFLDAVKVRNVAVQMEQAASGDEHRSADAGYGTVFLDAVHTTPTMDVPAGSRIDFAGHSYLVAEAARFETVQGEVHHWELTIR